MPTTIGSSVLAAPLPITRQRRLFCLFVCLPWHPYLLRCGCSLSIPHDMHLVVPTHHCFFWVIFHPSRTFPPKEPEQEPQNRFPLSPPLDHTLLPLTHDLTTSCIGWTQAGDVWALHVLYFCVCPKSTCCSCICLGLGAFLHILPPILDFLWRELLSDSSFSMAHSL